MMPFWIVPASSQDLPRNLALLDTNVLIDYINPEEPRHEDTVARIDLNEFRWAVSLPSILEAWNFLVGRQKRRDLAYALIDWILTPGQLILIEDNLDPLPETHVYSRDRRLDIVDAGLVNLADRISKRCEMNPAVHVATNDTKDFLPLFGHRDLRFNVFDFENGSSTAELA